DRDFLKHYLRLEKDGSLEYADSPCVFGEFDGLRHFRYLLLIGTVGQFIYLAKNILTNAGYNKGGRLLINLVGTKDSILTHFSTEPGENNQRWLDPFGNDIYGRSGHLLGLKCHDPNIQLSYRLVVESISEEIAKAIMFDAASQLGLAFNHQSKPRCFNYQADIFPWQQFRNLKMSNC
ncbi:MAG: hypothetical protein AB1631_29025, partial [Acidobacteriota bacterium]